MIRLVLSSLALLVMLGVAQPTQAEEYKFATPVNFYNDTDHYVWVDYYKFPGVTQEGLVAPHKRIAFNPRDNHAFFIDVYAYVKHSQSTNSATLCTAKKTIGNNGGMLEVRLLFSEGTCSIRVIGHE